MELEYRDWLNSINFTKEDLSVDIVTGKQIGRAHV